MNLQFSGRATRRFGTACTAAFIFVLGCSRLSAAVVYADGTFSPTNWTTVVIGATGSGTGQQMPNGGNPGYWWDVTNYVATTDMATDSFSIASTYYPATSGAIQSLSFQYDFITQLISGYGEGTCPAIFQNGIDYRLVTDDDSYPSSWTTLSWTDLTALDFSKYGDSTAHPDFSANGSAIEFGFTNINSGTGQFSNRTTGSGFDNFNVSIAQVTVPEPTVGLLALGGIGMLGRRRRRAR